MVLFNVLTAKLRAVALNGIQFEITPRRIIVRVSEVKETSQKFTRIIDVRSTNGSRVSGNPVF